jgi:hypothetical protein
MRTSAILIFITLIHLCLALSQETPESMPLELFIEQINVDPEDAYTHTMIGPNTCQKCANFLENYGDKVGTGWMSNRRK